MTRLLVLLLALALFAGCGGGDESDDGGGPSQESFTADVNQICREGSEKMSEVLPEENPTSQAELRDTAASALEDAAEAYEPYLARLRDLEAPADIEQDWDTFITRIGDAFELIPDLADATREDDRQRLQELSSEFTQIAEETRPFAEQQGLDDCLPSPEGG
jgi:hypothetical protein